MKISADESDSIEIAAITTNKVLKLPHGIRLWFWKLRMAACEMLIPKQPTTTAEEDSIGNEVEQVMADELQFRVRMLHIREHDTRTAYLREYLNQQDPKFIKVVYGLAVMATEGVKAENWSFKMLVSYCARLYITEYILNNRNDMSFIAPGKMETQEG